MGRMDSRVTVVESMTRERSWVPTRSNLAGSFLDMILDRLSNSNKRVVERIMEVVREIRQEWWGKRVLIRRFPE